LFALILSSVDVGRTLDLILRANPGFLLIGLLLVLLEIMVRSLNWMVLAGIYARGYGYLSALQTYMIGIAFGAVTPAKAGDFMKVSDLEDRTGLDLTKAFTVGLLDRIINFIFLFLSAGASVAAVALVVSGGGSELMALLIPLAAIVLALAVVLDEGLSLMVLRPLQGFLIPERFRGDTRKLFQTFHETLAGFKGSGSRWAVLSLTLLGWLVIFIRPYFFSQAIGMDVEWWAFILFVPIISVVEVLPLSVMGLGTRDATILILFASMGVGREQMIALSAMMLLLSAVPQVVLGYLIALNRKGGG
jgi:hypothetical protein